LKRTFKDKNRRKNGCGVPHGNGTLWGELNRKIERVEKKRHGFALTLNTKKVSLSWENKDGTMLG